MKKILFTTTIILSTTLASANPLCCKTKMCNNGDGKSCYDLGAIYEHNLNSNLSKRACSNVEALYSFSNCQDSRHSSLDYSKAIRLYKKSITLGYPKAYDALGVLYVKGKGVKKDFTKAKQLFYKSCMLGSQNGCFNYELLTAQRY